MIRAEETLPGLENQSDYMSQSKNKNKKSKVLKGKQILEQRRDLTQEHLLVHEDLASDLECAICLSLLQHPRQCKNGHLFCLECLTKCLATKPECPQCRASLTLSDLGRSLFVEQTLRNLHVFCKFRYFIPSILNSSRSLLDSQFLFASRRLISSDQPLPLSL